MEELCAFIAEQLGLDAAHFGDYAKRDQTRREHVLEIHAALRLRALTRAMYREVAAWLMPTALATDHGASQRGWKPWRIRNIHESAFLPWRRDMVTGRTRRLLGGAEGAQSPDLAQSKASRCVDGVDHRRGWGFYSRGHLSEW
jgi:hypothetical protein